MIRLISALCALACALSSASANEPPAEVMVLGVFHFDGGGLDLINPEVDDFLAPGRQQEISDVLDRLEAWRPDRIMIELEPANAGAFNARYQAWRSGQGALGVNETDQLGMRLAARLGHDRLYAIDYRNSLNLGAVMAGAQAVGQTHWLQRFEAIFSEIQAYMRRSEALDIRRRLIMMNAPEHEAFHGAYLMMAQIGTLDDPFGAMEVSEWWRRNLVMFSRIAAQSAPGERTLVIVGAGHKYLIEQYLRDAPGFVVADPLALLED